MTRFIEIMIGLFFGLFVVSWLMAYAYKEDAAKKCANRIHCQCEQYALEKNQFRLAVRFLTIIPTYLKDSRDGDLEMYIYANQLITETCADYKEKLEQYFE